MLDWKNMAAFSCKTTHNLWRGVLLLLEDVFPILINSLKSGHTFAHVLNAETRWIHANPLCGRSLKATKKPGMCQCNIGQICQYWPRACETRVPVPMSAPISQLFSGYSWPSDVCCHCCSSSWYHWWYLEIQLHVRVTKQPRWLRECAYRGPHISHSIVPCIPALRNTNWQCCGGFNGCHVVVIRIIEEGAAS